MRNVDLFAGIGGFHQGWAAHGVETVWASEWNKSSRETYEENYAITPAGDITKISAEDIPPHDVLSAGFPCQAFSISGKQLGFADTRGTLFFDVARIAKHHQPRLILLENVKNFAIHDKGRTLEVVVNVLKNMGYTVTWKVLSARDYGVPQDRKRIYIAAFREDIDVSTFTWPAATVLTKSVKNVLEPVATTAHLHLHRSDIQLDEGKIEQYNNLTSPAPTPLRVGIVGKGGQGERIYHYNGTSITLSAHGGGVGAKTGLYYTPEGFIRKLTPREAARLMGFPETFTPHPSPSQALQHFGNAVAVTMVKKIAHNMLPQSKLT